MEKKEPESDDAIALITNGYYGHEGEHMLDYYLAMELIRQKNIDEETPEITFMDIKKDWPMFLLNGVFIASAVIILNLLFS